MLFPQPVESESGLLALAGVLLTAVLGALAWVSRSAITTMLETVRLTADTVIRIETQLTGGDGGTGGVVGDVRDIRTTMVRQNDESHARLGEWTVWRTRKDGDDAHRDKCLSDHHERLSTLEGRGPGRTTQGRSTRRRTEDR